MQKGLQFVNLCYYLFFQFDILRNYDLILNSLNFRTLYFTRHLYALFLLNVFKGEINCHSILGTVGILVPTMQIRQFSTFSESSTLDVPCKWHAEFCTYSAKTMSPLRAHFSHEKVFRLITCSNLVLIELVLFDMYLLVFVSHRLFSVGRHSNKGTEMNWMLL
jgi:hypothetical protein